MMTNLTVEICVEGVASALEAGRGGADRVELCEHLSVGGVSPSFGAIAVACGCLAIPVNVLIRPRGGDFVYDEAEFEAMRFAVEMTRHFGAAGVVLGILRADGTIDEARTASLIEIARPMSVTFHRAFDETPDPFEAIDTLIALGIDHVLTSGQAASARLGLPTLSDLVRRSGGRIAVLAGGGVTEQDVPELVAAGIREIHAGSAACRDGRTAADAVARLVASARSATRLIDTPRLLDGDREGKMRSANLEGEDDHS